MRVRQREQNRWERREKGKEKDLVQKSKNSQESIKGQKKEDFGFELIILEIVRQYQNSFLQKCVQNSQ